MNIQTLEIVIAQNAQLPMRANPHDAGMDFFWIHDDVYLRPGDRTARLTTGVSVRVPVGFGLFLIPRSGKGSEGLHLANAVGLIDHSYLKPIETTIVNNGPEPIQWIKGDRFMQGVLVPVITPALIVVDSFEDSPRGGHGSTGQ